MTASGQERSSGNAYYVQSAIDSSNLGGVEFILGQVRTDAAS
jgi:hypothetical protein